MLATTSIIRNTNLSGFKREEVSVEYLPVSDLNQAPKPHSDSNYFNKNYVSIVHVQGLAVLEPKPS